MLLGERWIHHLNRSGSIYALYAVVERDIRVIIHVPLPHCTNQVSSSSYQIDRYYEEKKERKLPSPVVVTQGYKLF